MSSPGSPAALPTAPAMHPMDPRRGENLSPRFAAVLCWLLQLEPMTAPAITGIVVSGDLVLAATDERPFHDTPIGDWQDLERNLRDWGAASGTDSAAVEGLMAKLRRAAA